MNNQAVKWSILAHKLCQQLKDHPIQNKKILVALSAGADSVALLSLLLELQKYFNLTLLLAHVHHGEHENQVYRNQALQMAKQISQEAQLPFFFAQNQDSSLKSEEQLRDFRYEFLNQIKTQEQCDFIATAHHSDDLLETRLINLIRGVGLEKIKSMQILTPEYFRPLLIFHKKDLIDYLEQKNKLWIEDPSNLNNEYFRNWIRNEWLQNLEDKRPGSLNSLARSLEQISENKTDYNKYFIEENVNSGINATLFYTLSYSERKALLTSYIRSLGYKRLSRGFIDEINKYLDKNQKDLTLTLGGIKIQANAQQISLCIVREST